MDLSLTTRILQLAKSSYTLRKERGSIAISLGPPVMDHAVNPFLNFKRQEIFTLNYIYKYIYNTRCS